MIERRTFLKLFAPAVILTPGLLMPVRTPIVPVRALDPHDIVLEGYGGAFKRLKEMLGKEISTFRIIR